MVWRSLIWTKHPVYRGGSYGQIQRSTQVGLFIQWHPRVLRGDVIGSVRGWEGENRGGRIWANHPSSVFYPSPRSFPFSLPFILPIFYLHFHHFRYFPSHSSISALIVPRYAFFLLSSTVSCVLHDLPLFYLLHRSPCILVFRYCPLGRYSLFFRFFLCWLNSIHLSVPLFPCFPFLLPFTPFLSHWLPFFHFAPSFHRFCLVQTVLRILPPPLSLVSNLFYSTRLSFAYFLSSSRRIFPFLSNRFYLEWLMVDQSSSVNEPRRFSNRFHRGYCCSRWTGQQAFDEGSWNSSTLSSLWSLGSNDVYGKIGFIRGVSIVQRIDEKVELWLANGDVTIVKMRVSLDYISGVIESVMFEIFTQKEVESGFQKKKKEKKNTSYNWI